MEELRNNTPGKNTNKPKVAHAYTTADKCVRSPLHRQGGRVYKLLLLLLNASFVLGRASFPTKKTSVIALLRVTCTSQVYRITLPCLTGCNQACTDWAFFLGLCFEYGRQLVAPNTEDTTDKNGG